MFEFHPEARREYDSAHDWYAERSLKAAVRFEQELERTLERIAADPGSFATMAFPFRAASVRDFPFQIVYRIDESRIFVAAVAHSSRRADYWARRAE